ncbi:MAG: class I SAM-dependent methyltransferase [Limisphaerales bacterium]
MKPLALPSAPGTDQRIADTVRLLQHAPFKPTDVVLDVGMGDGTISRSIAARVSKVVGTGLDTLSYKIDPEALKRERIEVVECWVEKMPFPDATFDGAVMSHVLEHCLNVGLALQEVRRVLKPGGLLCVAVPPSDPLVCGGHVAVGWNIGQLMYVLTMAGFSAATGHFAKKGYNVCAFVRKEERPLPPLRHDFGDLRALEADGRFPLPIRNADPNLEAFWGDLDAVNWPWVETLDQERIGPNARLLRKLIPASLRPKLGQMFLRLAVALGASKTRPPGRTYVNPDRLQA